jgi:hypothetical protein
VPPGRVDAARVAQQGGRSAGSARYLNSSEEKTGPGNGMPGPVSLSREAAGANLPCLSQAPVEYAAMIYGQLRRIRLFRLTAKKEEPRWRRRGFSVSAAATGNAHRRISRRIAGTDC